MRIALVRARYTPHGGAERFAARAIRALAASGDEAPDLSIIARRWIGPDAPALARFIRCDPFYLGSVWRDASFARAVRRVVARQRFDLVQSHERIAGLPIYRAGDGVHAVWLERRARAASTIGRLAIAANPHHRYLVAAERAMFEHPALRTVICNSTMVRDEIAARFTIDPDKLVVIRSGVDVDRFHPDARERFRVSMRATLAIDADAPVFVLVGSGFERKGVAQAVEALRQVEQAVLVVVGGDRRLRRHRERAVAFGVGDRVRFTGPVDDPLPYLSMADAFVLPTLYDPFPNAALEAWAVGLPVITSDASGAAELVRPGVNGWIVGAGAVEPLVAAMREAASRDAARKATMAEAARDTALPLSLAALGSALLALYRHLQDRRPMSR